VLGVVKNTSGNRGGRSHARHLSSSALAGTNVPCREKKLGASFGENGRMASASEPAQGGSGGGEGQVEKN